MYSEDIYASWQRLQEPKYDFIFGKLGNDFFLNRKIADIGCGNCMLAAYMKAKGINAEITGSDISLKHLSERKAPIDVALAHGSPFRKVFDIAVAIDVLHLFPVEWPVIPGGWVIAGLFFNSSSFEEKRDLLIERLKGLKIKHEFIMKGPENELFMIAMMV